MNDTQQRLGKLIDAPAVRDAVHVAVLPIEAATNLSPGDRVFIELGKAVLALSGDNSVGIVDPFLPERTQIRPGQEFWLFLFPNTVTGMTHRWSHRFIDKALEGGETEAEKRSAVECCQSAERSMGWLIGFLKEHVGDPELSIERVARQLAENPDDLALPFECYGEDLSDFWDHLERATGATVPESFRREGFYRCAC